MVFGNLFGRGERKAQAIHVTHETIDASEHPEVLAQVRSMLEAQGIDLDALTGGTAIQMGQPMDPADAERYRQSMLGMLGSLGIDASAAAGPAPGADDVVTSLERLVRLRDAGALTQAEFEAQKARVLGGD